VREQGAGAGDFGGVGAVVFGDLGFGGTDVWGMGGVSCVFLSFSFSFSCGEIYEVYICGMIS
jgi:hypothetical protein